MSNDDQDRFPTQAFDVDAVLKESGKLPEKEPTINLEDTIHWTQKVAQLTGLANWDDSAPVDQTLVHIPNPEQAQEPPEQPLREPERRYYEILDQGMNRLQVSLFVQLLLLVLSGGSVLLSTTSGATAARMQLLILGQLPILLVSVCFGFHPLKSGVQAMLRGRLVPESLLVFSLAASILDWYLALKQLRMPASPVFIFQTAMALWADYDRRKTELRQMDTLRGVHRISGLLRSEGYYERRAGFLRGEGRTEDFLANYQQPTGPDRIISWFLLGVLLCCTAAAIAVGIRFDAVLGLRTWATALLVSFPTTGFIATSHPNAIVSRRLHQVGSVICGWDAVLELCKDGAVPLSDRHLFPEGTVKLNGVKFYTERDPDQSIAYAAALIGQEGGLAPLIRQLSSNRGCPTYTVKNQRTYTNGGMGGEVNGEPILVGTLRFLQSMGVELPEGARISKAVYLAVNGVLCAVFAIQYSRDRKAMAGLNCLCSYSNLRPVLLTGDFMLTAGFLRKKFGGHARRILCPTPAVRAALAAKVPSPDSRVCALLTQEHLEALAYTITGARSLRSAMKSGVFFQLLGGILGFIAIMTQVFSGSLVAASASNVLLFHMIQAIPALLLTQWARNF